MKRWTVCALFLFMSAGSLFASKVLDDKMGTFFQALKSSTYEQGIVTLLEGSALEEKVVNVTQTRNNWINQFTQIRSLYGDYLAWDKVSTVIMGRLEETTYLVYCEDYPIQLIITEYNNSKEQKIINMFFNDQILDTLRAHGKRF